MKMSTNISKWNNYSPRLTVFGAYTLNYAQWRRVGDSVEIRMSFVVGAGAGGPNNSIGLPDPIRGQITTSASGQQHIVGYAATSDATHYCLSVRRYDETASDESIGLHATTTSGSNIAGSELLGETVVLCASLETSNW